MIRFFRDGREIGAVDFCEPQLNLLAHAQAIELPTGSRCGGHGICGGDRVRVLSWTSPHPAALPEPFSPLTAAEREHLSDADLNSGIRLACQCFPNASDLVVELEIL